MSNTSLLQKRNKINTYMREYYKLNKQKIDTYVIKRYHNKHPEAKYRNKRGSVTKVDFLKKCKKI